jgi:hypothetical protein
MYKDDKKIRKVKKVLLINIWPTYDLPVRTEAGLSRRPCVMGSFHLKLHTLTDIRLGNCLSQGLVTTCHRK